MDIRGGEVYVNDEPLDDVWGVGETFEEYGAVIYPYTVIEGNLFVLGDNREQSMDSRAFGEVNRRQIKGRLVLAVSRDGIKRVSS